MVEEKKAIDLVQFEAVGESRSSFNLKSTSKGNTIEIKIYSGDSDNDVQHARELAEKHFDELKAKYKADES